MNTLPIDTIPDISAQQRVYQMCACDCGCEPCDYLYEQATWHDECGCRGIDALSSCSCVRTCGCR